MDKYTIDRIKQLEQRIHELEIKQLTDLDDVNKRMRSLDKKFRERIRALEIQVDSLVQYNNPNFVKCKLETYEGLPLNDNTYYDLPNTKIAIRVENQQEFELLKGILFSQGKRGLHFTQYQERFNLIEYEAYNGSINRYFNEHYIKSSTYYIIPFNILKTILS